MPEVQEVFRMATHKVRPDPGALERQHRDQRWRVAKRKTAVYVLVAAVAVAGVVIGIGALRSGDVRPGGPGSTPSPVPEPQGGEQTLSIVDVGSGIGTAFTAPIGASDFDVTLDGSMVTYIDLDGNGNAEVFVMGADGLNRRQLTFGESGNPRHPRWSPDDFAIAYERDTQNGSQIFIVPVSGLEPTQVTYEPRGAVDPAGWTPDGGSIFFSAVDAANQYYTARSLDLTTGKTKLIVADGSTPALSPDGTLIAFNSWLTPSVRLIIANSDGSDRRVIARLSTDGSQRWSPDSTQVAFVGSTDEDGFGTYVYDLASGESRFVTSGTIESWVDNDHILVS